ncbi:hypothetical protein LOTGIDRAFT_76871, partial [Lottia gigantea]
SSEEFDFFTLSSAWPKTVCLEGQTEKLYCNNTLDVAGWTIHGLWPSRIDGKEPKSCGHIKFNLKTLDPLMGDLLKLWPNLFKYSSLDSLWRHEWNKHGTCAVSDNNTATEFLFFKKALDVFKKINISRVMKNLNIVPSDTKLYSVRTISRGLKKHFSGIEPIIMCLDIKNKTYLHQIQVCYDKEFNMVDC